jgi:riboflavin kinase/FMN adenylyltransferase
MVDRRAGADRIPDLLGAAPRPAVVTIGAFDGVHAGHRALLATARRHALSLGCACVAVTFDPRPDAYFDRGALPSICTVAVRVRDLREAGADAVVILPFDASVAALPAERFVELLRVGLELQRLVVGEDFALGRGRTGDIACLRALGVDVCTVPPVPDETGTAKLSSSDFRRRAALTAAPMETVA